MVQGKLTTPKRDDKVRVGKVQLLPMPGERLAFFGVDRNNDFLSDPVSQVKLIMTTESGEEISLELEPDL